MSEVRPGGDSSDSLAEMTEPQNLQKSESSAESLRQPYRDKRYVNHTDDNVQIFPDNEQQSKSQKQYSAYIRDTGTDNDQAADSEVVRSNNDTNAAFAAKVHIRQLFVGNLPFRVRWQDLKDMFKKAGEVIRADVAIGFDNRSKGHGTVLFASVEDARQAVEMFHNYMWQGRILEVREDRGFIDNEIRNSNFGNTAQGHGINPIKTPQPSNVQVNNQSYGNMYAIQNRLPPIHPTNGRQLFVGNIPFNCQWQDLKDLFRNAGNILRADIAQGQDGRSRGFGTVLYATPEDARNAVEIYDGYEYQGRRLRVYFDKFASNPSGPQQLQVPPKMRTSFQDQIRLHSPPFSSRMPYPALSVPSVAGMPLYQSPPHPTNVRPYFPPYTTVSDMIIPTHMAFANPTLQESQGMTSSTSYTMNQMEQPQQFTSMLADTSNNFVPGAIGLPGGPSALGSLDTEVSGLSSYQGSSQLHMDSTAWNGEHQQSLMYRQHPNRTQQPEYSWLQPPMSHSFHSDTFLPNTHTEYMSNQKQFYENSPHDVEKINTLAESMSSLRFEGSAGLPPSNVYEVPTENTSSKNATAGRGGIVLGDTVWDRQEVPWDTPLTDSYKM
ncbi:hypothetical protein BGW37DRAFT_489478 [Umbelopsis sp. PMI_123]|nr:hypothetical protein BGW37DRAFT_489478 [Umbelopsis sp. PMI_123]